SALDRRAPPPDSPPFPPRRSSDLRQRPWNRGPAQRGWCPAGSRPARRTRTGQRLGELRRRLPAVSGELLERARDGGVDVVRDRLDRKSTRLNSSHVSISYAVFCLK